MVKENMLKQRNQGLVLFFLTFNLEREPTGEVLGRNFPQETVWEASHRNWTWYMPMYKTDVKNFFASDRLGEWTRSSDIVVNLVHS